GFSLNHSSPYSYIGYACAWLRYHYPLEFITESLNLQEGDIEGTGKIMSYAYSHNIEVKPIEFGKSRARYTMNKEENNIYKGISSIKFLNAQVAEELYDLYHNNTYDEYDWTTLFIDILEKTSANKRQIETLIKLDFFKEFGQ